MLSEGMGCSTRPRRCSPEKVRPAPACSPGRVVGWCVPPCHTHALALGNEAGTRVIVLRRARLCACKGRQQVAPSTVLCCLRWEVSSGTAEGGVGGGGVGWCPPFPHIRLFPLRSEWAKVVFQHLRGALRMRPLGLNQRSSGSRKPPRGLFFGGALHDSPAHSKRVVHSRGISGQQGGRCAIGPHALGVCVCMAGPPDGRP